MLFVFVLRSFQRSNQNPFDFQAILQKRIPFRFGEVLRHYQEPQPIFRFSRLLQRYLKLRKEVRPAAAIDRFICVRADGRCAAENLFGNDLLMLFPLEITAELDDPRSEAERLVQQYAVLCHAVTFPL